MEGSTALHLALIDSNLDCALELIKHGADVNKQIIYGLTPLFIAGHQGAIKVMDALISSGADINVQATTGDTPLHDVIDAMVDIPDIPEQKFIDSIQFLLEHGANPYIRNNNDERPCDVGRKHRKYSVERFIRSYMS